MSVPNCLTGLLTIRLIFGVEEHGCIGHALRGVTGVDGKVY